MKMRFLIIGAGAIGTYLGASLLLHEHAVLFLEKEDDIRTLRQRGLRMIMGEEEFQLKGAEFSSGLGILKERNFDLAILALKTYHLEGILPDLVALGDHLPPLLCLQNGVEAEKKLQNGLGERIVIAGTVTSAVDRLAKGAIRVEKTRGMGIAGDQPVVHAFQAVFNQAGLNCRYYRKPEAMKWSKLITNLLGNASSAILDLPPSAIYAHSDLYQMELDQIREALNVMRAQRIHTVNLPGVPVQLLSGIVRSTPAYFSQPILSGIIGGGRGEKMPSFHIDLHSGKGKSEVGDLNGAVVHAGKVLGIPTPVNDFLTNRLMGLISGKLPLNKYQGQPEQFLKDLEAFRAAGSLSG